MSMSNMRQDRENDKFVETTEGATAVRVVVDNEVAPLLPAGAATEAKQDTIIGHIDSIESSFTSLLGYVDGLEGFTDGLEGFVDGLEGFTDGIEGLLTTLNSTDFATEAKQDVIIGHVDGIETALVAANASLNAIEATDFATEAKQDVGNTSLASIDTKLTNPLPISGTTSSKTDLTPSAPTAASVGVASAQVFASAATRKGLVLVNTSVNTISIAFGSAAVLNSGITLYPGGTFEMCEYTFDTGAVNAIASAASSNLSGQEYLT